MNKLICEKDGYKLFKPSNEYDMNYHLIDTVNGIEYLIDIGDICDNEDEWEYSGGILWDELRTLSNLRACRIVAWKVIGGDE